MLVAWTNIFWTQVYYIRQKLRHFFTLPSQLLGFFYCLFFQNRLVRLSVSVNWIYHLSTISTSYCNLSAFFKSFVILKLCCRLAQPIKLLSIMKIYILVFIESSRGQNFRREFVLPDVWRECLGDLKAQQWNYSFLKKSFHERYLFFCPHSRKAVKHFSEN